MKIVECVPNFSEGRNEKVVNEIVSAIKSVEGIKLLDVELDADHNRSVITFVGDISVIKDAAFKGIEKAVKLINMEEHKGEHPRLGAADVVPFIPISNVKMDECVELAHKLGEEVWENLRVPVYFYEYAAKRPERKNLADVRKGEYEGRKENIHEEYWHPDVGEPKMHPTAGATIIGARDPLVAYNVNLGTDDIKVAKKIAKAVRASSGGYMYVKALGFEIKERGIVQVSMNLVNYKKTPIFRVFETIKRESERYGVPVIGSEIVGLVPLDALIDCADFYLMLEKFKKTQILEKRLWG